MMSCAIKIEGWGVKTSLLSHQKEAVAKLLPARVGALYMDMGTGKSRTAIELARLRQHKIDRVIWFCPVSLKPTIRYEILKHTDCSPESICVFDNKISVTTLPEALWYIVGIESMSSSARVVLSASQLITERSFVVVDESTYIKGNRAKRTERITWLSSKCRYRLILTGTPFTQGPTDLFSQMRFLSTKILGYSSWYSFARNHIVWSEKYRGKIDRCLNADWIAAKIRPYVYQVTKDECLDLPSKSYSYRSFGFTAEQEDAYEEAKRQFEVDMMTYDNPRSNLISSIPIFRLFTRLQGIACGFKSIDGKPIPIKHRRLDLLERVLSSIPDNERVVIWARYRFCTQEIVNMLTEEYGADSVCEFHGDISEKKREQELQRWRENGRFLVARQSIGSHGLDLTAARYVVFYANGFKYSERIQAEDRCHRIGQKNKVLYIDLWSDAKIEERIDTAIHKKGNALERFRQEVEKIKGSRKENLKKIMEAL
jgi:SNF2 family DNA or RNA helicase